MDLAEDNKDIKEMRDITWRAPVFGALILVIIGSVLAAVVCHSGGALKSIKAGLGAQYECQISHTFNSTRLCNDTGGHDPVRQDCVYVYVNYTDKKTGEKTSNIKLSASYFKEFHEQEKPIDMDPNDIYKDWSRRGKCSADFCGQYRYKEFDKESNSSSGPYLLKPPLLQTVQDNSADNNISCLINTLNPSRGAYLHLNYDLQDTIKDRMFRYYEGWILFVVPPILALSIFIALIVLFVRGDLSASPVERKMETFLPPGAAPPSPAKSDKTSSRTESEVTVNQANKSQPSSSNSGSKKTNQQRGSTEKLVSVNNNHV